MRDDRERLLDIREAIRPIEKYSSRGRDVFERNELVQTWIVHHLQIIGEAAERSAREGRIVRLEEILGFLNGSVKDEPCIS